MLMSNRTSFIQGFSLIELLVVIMIIALGIGFVSFNLDPGRNYKVQTEAKKFANTSALISEEAVLSNLQWSIDFFRLDENEIEEFGYRYLVRDEDGEWVAADNSRRELEYYLPGDMRFRLILENTEEQSIEFKQDIESISESEAPASVKKENKIEPEIWLYSSGEITPFRLEFFSQDNPEGFVVVSGDELGRIQLIMEESEDE